MRPPVEGVHHDHIARSNVAASSGRSVTPGLLVRVDVRRGLIPAVSASIWPREFLFGRRYPCASQIHLQGRTESQVCTKAVTRNCGINL